MGRNNRATLGVFLVAALGAFGGLFSETKAADLIWTGDATHSATTDPTHWNGTSKNFATTTDPSSKQAFKNGDNVTFDSTGKVKTVQAIKNDSLTGLDLTVGSMVVSSAYTFSGGSISSTVGDLTVTSSGAGRVVFKNNSLTFGTRDAHIGDNTLNNNTIVEFDTDFTFRDVNIGKYGTLIITDTNTISPNTSNFTGSGNLWKEDTGKFILGSGVNNTFSGKLEVYAGEMELTGGTSFGNASLVKVDHDAELTVTGTSTVRNLGGAGIVNIDTAVVPGSGDKIVLTGTTPASNNDKFTGLIKGNGDVAIGQIRGETGNITFVSTQTYSGTTHIDNGSLTLGKNANASPATYGALENSDIVLNNVGTNTFDIAAAGSTVNLKSVSTKGGNINSNAKFKTSTNTGTSRQQVTLDNDTGSNETFGGQLEGAANINLKNNYTLTNVSDNFTGILQVADGNALNLTEVASLKGTSIDLTDGAATLSVNKSSGSSSAHTETKIETLDGSTTSKVILGEHNQLTLVGGTPLGTFNGSIEGPSGSTSTDATFKLDAKAKSDYFVMNGTADFGGTVDVNTGTLRLGQNGDLKTSTLKLGANGAFDISNNNTVTDRTVELDKELLAGSSTSAITLGSNNLTLKEGTTNNNEIAAKISGNGAVNFTNNGKYILTGANTYIGGSNVTGGSDLTLKGAGSTLNSHVSVSGSGSELTLAGGTVKDGGVTVSNNGAFGGTGTVIGDVNIGNTGSFVNATTASGGSLNVTGNFIVHNGGTVTLDNSSETIGSTLGGVNVKATGVVQLGSSSTLNVNTGFGGVYTLFTGSDIINGIGSHASSAKINNGATNVEHYLRVINSGSGKAMQIVLLNSGQEMQEWLGSNGIWDSATANWSDPNSTSSDPIHYLSTDRAGGHVYFGDKGSNAITVVGSQNFDTIQVGTLSGGAANNRVIGGDDLIFSHANNYSSAILNAGSNTTLTIDSVLRGSSSSGGRANTDKLIVAGGGTVILNNHNLYAGGTTIHGSNTTLQLGNDYAAGTGDIVFNTSTDGTKTNNATLVLGSGNKGTYTFANEIKDLNTASNNTVKVAEGSTVTLTNTGNSYYAKTVIGDNATLVAGHNGVLSQNSVHELGVDSMLTVTNGTTQTVKGLKSDNTSVLNLASGTLYVNNASNNSYQGTVIGTGALVNEGAGSLAIYDVDSSRFTGKLYAGVGGMNVYGADNSDLHLNIGSMANKTNGTFTVVADKGRDITLANADGTSSYNGKVNIKQGNLVLDSSAESLLGRGSELQLTGSEASMYVNDSYKLGTLTLGGSTVAFNSENKYDNPAKLTVDKLEVTSASNIVINSDVLESSIGNHNFFELDKGVSDFIIEAGSVTAASSGLIKVVDENGDPIEANYEHNIRQGGKDVGIAYVETESGVSTSGTEKGVFFTQTLTAVESLAGTPDVVISSTPTSTISNPKVAKATSATEQLDAKLMGDGGFEFVGNRNIILANDKNDYTGQTVIDMSKNDIIVAAGSDNAFGNTSLLDVRQGAVHLDGQSVTVGAVSGGTQGSIVLGDKTDPGVLSVGTKAGSPKNAVFHGTVTGFGDITKTGDGSQSFSGGNNLIGDITVNGGSLAWAGSLLKSGTNLGNVSVTSGTFTQLDSRIAGNVQVRGSGSAIDGNGTIDGDLAILDGAVYRVTSTTGALDKTTVGGTTTFGTGTDLVFSNEAKQYMIGNPNAPRDVLDSRGGLDLTQSPWSDTGVITADLGILGTATIVQEGNKLVYEGISRPVDPIGSIKNSWRSDGIDISDVVERSNIGQVSVDTVTKYLWESSSAIKNNKVVNARYANSNFLGHVLGTNSKYSEKEVLSVFNYDSGYTATLPVQAALDTTRAFVGQGLKNRINNLRAARTILSSPVSGFAQGYGYGYQSYGAYASTIVQDAFGYNAPAYMGATYYDPYTGAPGYACAPQTTSYAPTMGYAPPSMDNGLNMWAGGVGNWNKQKTSSGGIGGYKYDAGGFMVGADYIAGPVVFGGAFGYSRGKLEDEEAIQSDTKIDAYSANLYADYNHSSGINTMLFGGYTWFNNKVDRTVAGYRESGGLIADFGNENHKYRSTAWYVGTALSYDYIPTNRLTLTPSIGVEWYEATGKAHTRNLMRSSGVVLRDEVEKMRGRSLTAPIDVAATYDIIRKPGTKLSAMANVGYSYEFLNKGPNGNLRWMDMANSPTIEVVGRKPGRSGLNVGAGARFQKNCMSFDVKYDFYKRKDDTSHRVAANVGWSF